MITLPKNLTATKYNGYFWDTIENKLYSIKIDGTLRELKPRKLNKFCKRLYQICKSHFYVVSNKGQRRYLTDLYLYTLKLKDSEIPTKEKTWK